MSIDFNLTIRLFIFNLIIFGINYITLKSSWRGTMLFSRDIDLFLAMIVANYYLIFIWINNFPLGYVFKGTIERRELK